MMKKLLARTVFAALLVVVAAVPVALGQGAAAPLAKVGMDIQVWPEAEPGRTVVIASANITSETALPARVRIPVIEGMDVQWVGEISPTSPSDDPTRTYTTEQGKGGKFVEFEVTEYRLAQVEMIGAPPTTQGDRTTTSIRWIQSVPATSTGFNVRTIAGVRDVEIKPEPTGEAATNPSGESLYTLKSQRLKTGQEAEITVAYATGTEFEGGGLSGGGNTNLIIGVLAATLVVAVIVLVWAVRRQNSTDR